MRDILETIGAFLLLCAVVVIGYFGLNMVKWLLIDLLGPN
jgi:hypothetical protein